MGFNPFRRHSKDPDEKAAKLLISPIEALKPKWRIQPTRLSAYISNLQAALGRLLPDSTDNVVSVHIVQNVNGVRHEIVNKTYSSFGGLSASSNETRSIPFAVSLWSFMFGHCHAVDTELQRRIEATPEYKAQLKAEQEKSTKQRELEEIETQAKKRFWGA